MEARVIAFKPKSYYYMIAVLVSLPNVFTMKPNLYSDLLNTAQSCPVPSPTSAVSKLPNTRVQHMGFYKFLLCQFLFCLRDFAPAVSSTRKCFLLPPPSYMPGSIFRSQFKSFLLRKSFPGYLFHSAIFIEHVLCARHNCSPRKK